MSALSERPENPIVGIPLPHESAALHVTGEALYTDDLVGRMEDYLEEFEAHGTDNIVVEAIDAS